MLRVTPKTVRKLAKNKAFHGYRLATTDRSPIIYDRAEIEAYVDRCSIWPDDPEAPANAED